MTTTTIVYRTSTEATLEDSDHPGSPCTMPNQIIDYGGDRVFGNSLRVRSILSIYLSSIWLNWKAILTRLSRITE